MSDSPPHPETARPQDGADAEAAPATTDESAPEKPATRRTARDLALDLALWLLIWGGLAAALWFYPLPTLGIAALLLLLRFLSC